MKHLPILLTVAAGISLAATAGSAQIVTSGQWSLIEAEQVAGKHLFETHCVSCHGNQPGRSVLAPSLRGIVGRPAASLASFQYSDALKNSKLVWTEDNLRKWISDNAHMVPGTLMPHVSISDPAEVIYLVEYLKTLKAPQKP